ncbi:MAG: rRNA adenine N-6-methyltransferase family protein, partial [Planctomycetota bacterium]|nr:rRNA adenine N-6-methyltransferase family protein [Planctomycetota bacterium]
MPPHSAILHQPLTINHAKISAMSIRLRTKSDLKAVFQEYNIWARKELGQNFLIDHNLLRFLVESGEVGENDFLLDIGAGTGLLTRKLAQSLPSGETVEIDSEGASIDVVAQCVRETPQLLPTPD